MNAGDYGLNLSRLSSLSSHFPFSYYWNVRLFRKRRYFAIVLAPRETVSRFKNTASWLHYDSNDSLFLFFYLISVVYVLHRVKKSCFALRLCGWELLLYCGITFFELKSPLRIGSHISMHPHLCHLVDAVHHHLVAVQLAAFVFIAAVDHATSSPSITTSKWRHYLVYTYK